MTARRSLRIAMVLPEPRQSGGVPGTGRLLAHGLAALGHEVDAYTVLDHPHLAALLEAPGLHPYPVVTGFAWQRWYSRRAITAHLAQLLTRAVAYRRLAGQLAEAHQTRPYDVVYRFSTIELLGLGRRRAALPPIVVHPETHAAGELAAMRRERDLARRCEPWHRRALAEAVLAARSRGQRRALRRVDGVIAPSARFARYLHDDYGVDPAIVRVAPNPVDLERFRPPTEPDDRGPWQLVFVGRVSVRKGIDQLVALSRRLVDLSDQVQLEVIGDATLWSDYRALLRDLDPRVARATGALNQEHLAARLREADALVQPSTYEPFAITVAEGLASGVPVIASTEVGATEQVDEACCTRLGADDLDQLEAAVRQLVARLEEGERPAARAAARAEAERLFSPERAAALVAEALAAAADRTR